MTQQTAIDWLIKEIIDDQTKKSKSKKEWWVVFDQAKQMEKEQIAKAWDAGYYGYFSLGIREIEFNNGEEYYDINYNETYIK